MKTTQIVAFGILRIIVNLSGADSCKFGVNCDYPCHCQNNAVCDTVDGSCQAGCDDGDLYHPEDQWYTGAWYGYGCQIGNVAYGKKASQGPVSYFSAHNAIDGSHDPSPNYGAWPFGGTLKNPVWWQVDLGNIYVVIGVNITNTDSHQYRTDFLDITVGSAGVSNYKLCKTLNAEGAADTIYVLCNPPRIGREVRFQKNGHPNDIYEMCLPEVQVYGYLFHECSDGYFGVACGTSCNCRDPCANINGVCSSGHCTEGWTGADCQTECQPGTWGDMCRERCHCQDSHEVCNHINGSCTSGCGSGYGGLHCNLVAADSSTPKIVGAVVGCLFVAILIIVAVIYLRRYRLQKGRNNNDLMSTNVSFSQRNGSRWAGDDNNIPCPRIVETQLHLTQDGECKSPLVSDDHIYGNQDPVGRTLPVSELETYIYETSRRGGGFAEEFSQISSGVTAVSDEGGKTENRKLNRFNNICAYDHSRVVLKASFGGNKTGFINASYIHKYKEQAGGYIAAQGPKKSTVVDMWTMVWQTDANRIVMLTNLWEAGRVKCEQYWPDQGMVEFGKFKVSLVDSQKCAEYKIRILSLALEKSEPRPVYHFHFTGWPDKGVPDEATSLLDFRRKIRSHDEFGKGPLIVHCSAGIGRTGTFLAVDYLLEQAKAEGVVDLVKYTYLMRSNRMNMIQTPVQYAFVYKALLEAHQTGETVIPSHEMEARYSELKAVNDETGRRKIEEQFMLLQKLKAPAPIHTTMKPVLSTENVEKNRDKNIVAANEFRMYLNSQVDGTNDYVNAVGVDGYLEHMAYMATQLPLPHTVVDLWRLLYDHKCSCIVMLESPNPDDESTPVYWPTATDRPMVIAQLTVSLVADEDLEEGAIKMMVFEIKINSKNPHIVRLYQFSHWPNGTERPTSLETTLKLMDHIHRWQLRSDQGEGAVCFQCKYGYERSGLMIAACYMLEKLREDREVDVFHAVKQVRIPRPEFVTSLAQYELLHELAITWINSFGIYANF